MAEHVAIRRAGEADRAGIQAVAAGLPEWFDEHARDVAIPTDIRHQEVFVAVAAGEVVGFVSVYVSEGRANIGWIGVRRDLHRRGIGSRLLAAVERRAGEMGIAEVAVMTLGDGVDYPPYEATRAFYARCGFTVRRRSTTDNPGCPEELRLVRDFPIDLPAEN